MNKETMRVAEALSELKVLEDRLEKAISTGVYVATCKHSSQKIDGKSIKDYSDQVITASLNKSFDLIRRFDAIKGAVSRSNAQTIVKVADREYTVAEAIFMKQRGIAFKQHLLDEMKSQYMKAQQKLAFNESAAFEEKASNYATGIYGSKDVKASSDEIEKVKKAFIEANRIDMIDPSDILKVINRLEEEITSFTSKVDAALNISNAVTEITVEY